MQFQDKYHAQGQEHLYEDENLGATQVVKFFQDEPILQSLRMMSIVSVGSFGDKRIAGFYLDEDFTRPVTDKMTAAEITKVYVRWGKTVDYRIHFINGDIQQGTATEGTPIMEILENWHMGSVVDGYRNTEKFYSNAAMTNEIISVIAGDIFVGIEPLPTITIV